MKCRAHSLHLTISIHTCCSSLKWRAVCLKISIVRIVTSALLGGRGERRVNIHVMIFNSISKEIDRQNKNILNDSVDNKHRE